MSFFDLIKLILFGFDYLYFRIHQKYDNLATRVSDSAMEVTQAVTHSQFQERNKFVNYIKQKKTENIQVKKQWQDIVQNLTHER